MSGHGVRTRYATLQALRAVAALVVVIFHAIGAMQMHGDPAAPLPFVFNGGFGVDIFFVISGFVMAVTIDRLPETPGAAGLFLHRRLERIVPPYWIVTGLLAALLLLAPGIFQTLRFDGGHLLRSLLFLPQPELPLLQIGWSLNFEIYFYLLLALMLAMAPRRNLAAYVTVLLVAPVLLLPVSGLTAPAALFLGSPLMLEFLSGLWLGKALMRGATAPAAVGFIAIGLAVAGFAWSQGSAPAGFGRLLWWGAPAFLLVSGGVLLEGKLPIPRLLLALGDSSYSLYLTHTFVVIGAAALLKSLGGGGMVHNVTIVIAGVTLSLMAGELFYRYVERPLLVMFQPRQVRLTAD